MQSLRRVSRIQAVRSVTNARRSYRTFAMGTDEMTKPKTLYERLGFKEDEVLAEQRTPQEIRQAYIRTVAKAEGDETKIKDATAAFQELSNPRLKINYTEGTSSSPDTLLGVRVDGGASGYFNPEHVEFDFTEKPNRTFGDFTDAFNAATDRVFEEKAPPPDDGKPHAGTDAHFLLRLSFDEAYHGCVKEIEYVRSKRCRPCDGSGKKKARAKKCVQCHGKGYVQLPSSNYTLKQECSYCSGNGVCPPPPCSACAGLGRKTQKEVQQITVPPAAHGVNTWVLKGLGNEGIRGGRAGNLLVKFLIEEHRIFHRVDLDLHVVVPVPLSVALLGGMATVPTLRGPTQVRIPPGSGSGRIVSLDGFGIHDAANQREGSLKAHLLVVYPSGDTLTGRQRESLASFSPVMGTRLNHVDAAGVEEEPGSFTQQEVESGAKAFTVTLDENDMAAAKRAFGRWLPTDGTGF